MNRQEIAEYEESLKKYRDLYSALKTTEKKGMTEGIIKGKIEEKIEIAQKAIAMGMSIKEISDLTSLSETQIEELIKKD